MNYYNVILSIVLFIAIYSTFAFIYNLIVLMIIKNDDNYKSIQYNIVIAAIFIVLFNYLTMIKI